jgi:diguanylate cyclase
MHAHFDIWLLVISVLTAGAALLFTFEMVNRVYISTPANRSVLLLSFALIAGTGLWANHLLISLAFHDFSEIGHDPIMLIMAWFFAVGIAFVTLNLASKPHFNLTTFISSSILSSACTLALYYSFLMGLHSPSSFRFIPYTSILAALLSFAVCFTSSLLLFSERNYIGRHPTLIKIVFAYIIASVIIAENLALNNATIIDFNLFNENLNYQSNQLVGVTIALSVMCLFLLLFVVMLYLEKHGYELFSFKLFDTKKKSAHDLHSTVDSLTKLPNRKGFQRNLENALNRNERSGGTIAVAYIDLDYFKPINDNYGHHVGDIILSSVANRLNAAIRGCDSVARIGGDEFIAILEEIKSDEDIIPIVERILSSIKEPFMVNMLQIELSCSIGIAVYPRDGDIEKLVISADSAMYKAKENGKNQFKFYDAEIELASDKILKMKRELRAAIDNNEFSLAFQPKIDCKTQAPIGAEAFIRWHHPTKGIVLPKTFIPTAERLGLINQINDWVMTEACSVICRAKELDIDLNLSINLAHQQFSNMQLVQETIQRFDTFGVPAQNLTIEIKETSTTKNEAQVKRLLAQFKEAGIKIAVGDFGLNPFTLTYLQDLNIDEIKLSRTFISKVDKDNASRSFIDAVIQLAHALGLNVVAEGVETKSQRDELVTLGCNQMQGYLFSKPISEAELFQLFKPIEADFNPNDDFLSADNKTAIVKLH